MSAVTSLARVARTPRPPYYAVTTTTELAPGYDAAAHLETGARLYREAHGIGGFLGLEVFFSDGASIAVSYWRDLEAVARWREHPLHRRAKAVAKAEWFGATITRIARVEDDYGFGLAER
jgi:heme-degrading monooxygenase HmoA